MSVRRQIFRFHYGFVTRLGRGVGMGVRDIVEKMILTQRFFEGALGCKTLADWWYFVLSWAKAWRGRSGRNVMRQIFRFHHELLTRLGRGVGMGVRDSVA